MTRKISLMPRVHFPESCTISSMWMHWWRVVLYSCIESSSTCRISTCQERGNNCVRLNLQCRAQVQHYLSVMSCSIKIAPCLGSFILSNCAGSVDHRPPTGGCPSAQHKMVHSVGFEQPTRFLTRDSTPSCKGYPELINDSMLIILIIRSFRQRESFIIIITR